MGVKYFLIHEEINMKSLIYIIIGVVWLCSCSTDRAVQTDAPHIITVEDWGGIGYEGEYRTHTIERITLHHSGEDFLRDKDPGETLRNLQSWSRSDRNWIDIPYHYLIDLDGNIYEGRDIRYPGDTNTNYDPTGHGLICLLGNYEIAEPNEKQLNAIIEMMAMLCREYNVDAATIKSHRDYVDYTVCPGENLYSYLSSGYLIESVSDRLKVVRQY